MTVDRYAGGAEAWARGATLVYAPIAREVVAMVDRGFAGRAVLDVGAGTGVSSELLVAGGATVVAADLSIDMLRWDRAARPPSVAADVRRLPLRDRSVDDVVASFVLNHLEDPAVGMRELRRLLRPGGSLLATTYANASRSVTRDTIDQVAQEHGWTAPDWYLEVKASVAPILGSAEAMSTTARDAGLEVVAVEERPVDVGVTEAEDLVDYRFGQAHISGWLAEQPAARRAALRRDAIAAVAPIMEPYRPIVVFLHATA